MPAVTLTAPSYTGGSKSRIGRGSIVAIGGITGATGTEVWTPIEELKDSSPNGSSWEMVDPTNFQSGVDKEKRKSIRDNGKFTLKGNLLSATQAPGQQALIAAYNDPINAYDFVIQEKPGVGQTTGDQYQFSGLVMSYFDFTISTTALIEFTATIEVTGAITTVNGS